jgi:hypothetical protein
MYNKMFHNICVLVKKTEDLKNYGALGVGLLLHCRMWYFELMVWGKLGWMEGVIEYLTEGRCCCEMMGIGLTQEDCEKTAEDSLENQLV